jgi:LCP family protein required for cell wall assembly
VSSELIDEPSASTDKGPSRWRSRWPVWSLVIAAVVTLIVAVLGYGAYAKLTSNLKTIEINRADLGEKRPVKTSTALNILVIGVDLGNVQSPEHTGQRTDTIMLVHLSPQRNEGVIVSFPRDSMVQLPACRSRDGLSGQQRRIGIINSSFSLGGMGCIWKTIETLTGIHVDHAVMVDFAGFRNIVDAIDGVELCIPEPIHDEYAPLTLSAGWQTLRGEQALGYVRARHDLGDGSDIGRIQRQQNFAAAIAKKSMSVRTLVNPIRLFNVMNAITQSVVTDSGLTVGVMSDIARRALSIDQLEFAITPWRYSVIYPDRVEWRQGPAKKLFRLISTDQPVSGSLIKDGETASPLPSKVDGETTLQPDDQTSVTTPPPMPLPCAPGPTN